MYIISVMPLERKAHTDILSYFSLQKIATGMIVNGTWRKKTILCLVTDCTPLEKTKLSIKGAGFTIKKIQKIIGPSPLLPAFISATEQYSNAYGVSTRNIFDTLIPTKIFSSSEQENFSGTQRKAPITKDTAIIGGKLFTLNHYITTIENNRAHHKGTLILAPSTTEATEIDTQLKAQGVTDILLVKNTTPLQHFQKETVYIASPTVLGYPFLSLGSIIVVSENSHLYTLRNNIHIIAFIKKYAAELAIPILWSSTIPSLSLFKNIEEKNITVVYEKNKSRIKTHIISMKDKKKLLDSETVKTIAPIVEKKGYVFAFSVRRGYAEVTLCHDCKTILRCPTCNRPLVLHRQGTKNWYLCHRCGTMENTLRKCASCESWDLRPLGIGTDSTFEAFKNTFPDTPIYKIDSDTATTKKKLTDTLTLFYKTGGILIGTEMALRQLKEQSIDISIIVSFDSLFALPHFSIEERMLEVLSLIEEKTKDTLFIETIFPEQPIFSNWQTNTLPEYLHGLLEERAMLAYPPFSEVWLAEKIVSPDQIQDMQSTLSKQFDIFAPHFHIHKTKDKKLKIGATIVVIQKNKELFERKMRELKNAGYTLLYNPASLF